MHESTPAWGCREEGLKDVQKMIAELMIRESWRDVTRGRRRVMIHRSLGGLVREQHKQQSESDSRIVVEIVGDVELW